jgi:hypothetical protein
MKRIATGWVLLCGAACGWSGCQPADPPGRTIYDYLQHEDPRVRATAIRMAMETRNSRAVPFLIDRLSDTEPQVRMFAGSALKTMTDQDFGWKPYEPPDQRRDAIRKWRHWWADQAETEVSE